MSDDVYGSKVCCLAEYRVGTGEVLTDGFPEKLEILADDVDGMDQIFYSLKDTVKHTQYFGLLVILEAKKMVSASERTLLGYSIRPENDI